MDTTIKMKTKIYIHIATMGHFNQTVNTLLDKINSCELYDKADEINLNVCGDGSLLDIKKMPKYNITNETQDTEKCEFPTLDKIWEDSQIENSKVLYLHTKGVSKQENNLRYKNWIQNLHYFNIEKWEDNIKNLEMYDTSGINYVKNPKNQRRERIRNSVAMIKKSGQYTNASHYRGNFWWANSCHIKKLKKPSDLVLNDEYRQLRWIAEFWIGGNNPNAHSTRVNVRKFKF